MNNQRRTTYNIKPDIQKRGNKPKTTNRGMLLLGVLTVAILIGIPVYFFVKKEKSVPGPGPTKDSVSGPTKDSVSGPTKDSDSEE
jgi:hypothetical protein